MDRAEIESNIVDLVEAFRGLGVKYATVSANVTEPGVLVTLTARTDGSVSSIAAALGAPAPSMSGLGCDEWMRCSHRFSDDVEILLLGPSRKIQPAVQP